MKLPGFCCVGVALSITLLGLSPSPAAVFDSSHGKPSAPPYSESLSNEIRGDMGFLASDELRGRGSATRDEHVAVLFAATQFQAFGLTPGGDRGTYIQTVSLPHPLPNRVTERVNGFEATDRSETWNAVAILRGTDPAAGVILLTAHIDHLGVALDPAAHDRIYNGADDDASGTTAVLVLAHALSRGPRPRRTVVFALFGSEEIGRYGSTGFLEHPPVPLQSLVANLEFEMIGRPDPAEGAVDRLWLTGYERSNLAAALAKHGAPINKDPHPAEHFFQRSDNIALARRGIVAHTVSSFGLHGDYHQPSDELSAIDFHHLQYAITSMLEPIRWLANTDWRPEWNPGGRP